MPDEAGASTATGSASADAQSQDALGTEPAGDGQGGTDAAAATPSSVRSPEELLADAVAAEAADGQDGGGNDPLKAAQAEAARWRELARKQEKRAKENAEKAKNYDAYTESQKTEQQKLADRAAEAERRAAEAEGRYHRTLAAAQYDLPPSLIDHLHGSTEEEINASAEAFATAINERAAVLAAAQAQANGGGQQPQQPRNGAGFRPVESLRPGALPASDSKPQDPNAWLRAALTKQK